MKPRMMILLVIAAGLGVYFATKAAAPPPENTPSTDGTPEERATRAITQTPLEQRELAGESPAEEPDLSIRLEVDPAGKKNRLFYYISESHGYYVETFTIDVYHVSEPGGEPDEEPILSQYINDFLEANETLKGCFELVPSELKKADGGMGTSENWYAEISRHGRHRAENPEPLPPLANVNKCD